MSAEEALEEIDKLIDLVDDIEANHENTWERGEDFLDDVRTKLRSVRKTIDEKDDCTERQAQSIENWGDGIKRWHPDHR
jgi:polyhydroxyalkanoate synthesis regulator phasin